MIEPGLALQVLEALPHAVNVVDGADRLAYANAAFWRDAGVPRDACLPGSPLRDIVRLLAFRGLYGAGDPEAQAEAVLSLDRSRPTRRQIGLPDGSRSFETNSVPLPGGGYLSISHDITALLRAREQQAERARLLEATLAGLQGGVARFDAELRLGLFNAAYESLIGLPGGTLRPGMTHRNIVALLEERGEFASTADAEGVLQRLERDRYVAASRQQQRPHGKVLRFDSQPAPDGGFTLEVSDITALKRAEDEATRRAVLLNGVLAALPHGVCMYGPDGRVAMFNEAYARIMDGAEVRLGDHIDEVCERRVAQGEYSAEYAAISSARRSRRVPTEGMVRRRSNGTAISIRAAPLPDGGHISVVTDVTPLHDAEEAARDRAELLDAVLEALPDGVVVYGRDRRARMTNPAYRAMLGDAAVQIGESQEELAERHIASGEQSREEAEALVRRHLGPAAQAGEPIRRLRPNGTAIVTRAGRLPDGGQIAVMTDITPLHRAEEELRHRAAMLEASFRAMRHGLAIFGPDRRLLAANERTAALAGIAPEHFAPGGLLEEILEAQLAAGVLTPEQAAEGAAYDRSLPLRRSRVTADGRVIEVASDPTPDGGFVITFTDSTALHRAEAELRHRAAMQEAMLATIRHGIILYGPDRRVLAANAKAHELTGTPPDRHLPGRLMDEIIDEHVAHGRLGAEQAARMKAYDRRLSLHYERVRPDGRVIDTVSEPVPDGGCVITYSDVTEERRIRAELERARLEAEAASEAKSRFLATMSHELRTPLGAVIGFSDAIAAERDPARIAEYAAAVNEAGRHLLQLVDDILDVARSQTGALRVLDEPFAPAAVIAAAGADVAPAAAARGLELVTVLPAGLPLLRGDAGRLRQLLDKLLSNAVKFTPAGGRVTLSAEADARGFAIRVADTGIGIPPAERERMFEPFTQLDSSLARRFQGSGLGLHLARSLAEALGGTLTLEDPEGPGIVAALRFPRERLLAEPVMDPISASRLPA